MTAEFITIGGRSKNQMSRNEAVSERNHGLSASYRPHWLVKAAPPTAEKLINVCESPPVARLSAHFDGPPIVMNSAVAAKDNVCPYYEACAPGGIVFIHLHPQIEVLSRAANFHLLRRNRNRWSDAQNNCWQDMFMVSALAVSSPPNPRLSEYFDEPCIIMSSDVTEICKAQYKN